MSEALDKLVVDAAGLDERLSIHRPTCFLCGHRITRKNFLTIDSTAFEPLHAHQFCADAIGGARALAERAWKCLIAAHTGKAEQPTPARAVVRGAFR